MIMSSEIPSSEIPETLDSIVAWVQFQLLSPHGKASVIMAGALDFRSAHPEVGMSAVEIVARAERTMPSFDDHMAVPLADIEAVMQTVRKPRL
jgi:hypothetical protein